MTPRKYFDEVWERCDLFSSLHGYLATRASAAVRPEELLRAEWAARVSALDLFIHELVAQKLVEIFAGSRATCDGFQKMQISGAALMRIQAATVPSERISAYDLEVRTRLGKITYQHPDDIADGIRLISSCKLWNEVALHFGANAAGVSQKTKEIKNQLSAIVDRRNKIVHEGDLQPTVPRTPWPIGRTDVDSVAAFIERVVTSIDAVV